MGLGLLRIATQMDPTVRGVWEDDSTMHLVRKGSIADERDYLLRRWAPTPVVSPWNSPFDGAAEYRALRCAKSDRLADYHAAIVAGEAARGRNKIDLIRAYRATAPEAALDWVDACLREDARGALRYHWLLGSGGNDVRLDFSRNYMRATVAVIDPDTGLPTGEAETTLDWLLAGDSPRLAARVTEIKGGQFFGGSTVLPWQWLLAIEGCMAIGRVGLWHLADGADFPGQADLTAAGMTAASSEDEMYGAEFWWPIWREPLALLEVEELLRATPSERGCSGAVMAMRIGRMDRRWRYLRVARTSGNGMAHFLSAQGIY